MMWALITPETSLWVDSWVRAKYNIPLLEFARIINFNLARSVCKNNVRRTIHDSILHLSFRVAKTLWLHLGKIKRVKTLFVAYIKVQTTGAVVNQSVM